MRKILLSTVMIVLMTHMAIGQKTTTKKENLTVKLYDETGQIIDHLVLKGPEARTFNLSKFIESNAHKGRIVSYGGFSHDEGFDRVRFDSNNLDLENVDEVFICEEIVPELIPTFGVRVSCNDDLVGVSISEVAENSTADLMGYQVGDIILQINDHEIISFCDFKKAINAYEVGQSILVHAIKSEEELKEPAILGAQLVNNLQYVLCEKSEDLTEADIATGSIENMEVTFVSYPNPTKGLSQIKFQSEVDQAIEFMVLNYEGAVIDQRSFDDFSGSIRFNYNFNQHPSGAYYFVVKQNEEVYKQKVVYIND